MEGERREEDWVIFQSILVVDVVVVVVVVEIEVAVVLVMVQQHGLFLQLQMTVMEHLLITGPSWSKLV